MLSRCVGKMEFIGSNLRINSIIAESIPSVGITSEPERFDDFREQLIKGFKSLNLLKKILVQLGIGKWLIGSYAKPDWSGKLPFYIWKCSNCKQIVIGHSMGFKTYLQCPVCIPN